jgi:hypothetical protein
MELHTPPKRLFGDDQDVDQEDVDQEDVDQEECDPEGDTSSFVEEDTPLGVPLSRGLDDEDKYGEEEELQDHDVVLPKMLNFTSVRTGADSPDENEDERPTSKSATGATPPPEASVPLPKVDIPLERFVVGRITLLCVTNLTRP